MGAGHHPPRDSTARPQLAGGASRLAEALAAIPTTSGLADLAGRLEAEPAYRKVGSIGTTLSLPSAGGLQPLPWRTLVQLDPTANRETGWVDKTWGVAWPYPAAELEAVTAR